MQLAHLNVARVRAPLGDPLMADFTNNIERINRLAEQSEGFVWRLEADGDGIYGMAAGAPDVILTLSVWESLAALRSFVFKSDHAGFLRRRRRMVPALRRTVCRALVVARRNDAHVGGRLPPSREPDRARPVR
jgi:hypothetical protein